MLFWPPNRDCFSNLSMIFLALFKGRWGCIFLGVHCGGHLLLFVVIFPIKKLAQQWNMHHGPLKAYTHIQYGPKHHRAHPLFGSQLSNSKATPSYILDRCPWPPHDMAISPLRPKKWLLKGIGRHPKKHYLEASCYLRECCLSESW